jgi:hypothetical protein
VRAAFQRFRQLPPERRRQLRQRWNNATPEQRQQQLQPQQRLKQQ